MEHGTLAVHMQTPGCFTDAHLHTVEPDYGSGYPDLGDACMLMGCTAHKCEWDDMLSTTDTRIVRSIGIHPWYCDEWNVQTESELRGLLESDTTLHVGEIGLDSKRGELRSQAPVFERQLGIASEMDRIASIHSIGTEKEVLESIRSHGKGCRGIILHSYGSDSYVKPYSELPCFFSISPRILSRSETRVGRLLSSIPLDRLLLETDAPHQGRNFTGMSNFITVIAGSLDMEPSDLRELVNENLGRLIHG